MNQAYAYNRQKTSATVINRIYYLMNVHGWSVKTLSDEADIPYETLKKLLNRKIENTSIHNIIKIATAFQCNIDFLLGSDKMTPSEEPLSKYSQNILSYLKQVDYSFSSSSVYNEGIFVPVFTPESLFKGSHSSFSSMDNLLDLGSYPSHFKELVTCGIAVQSPCYQPVFHAQDILLISQSRVPHSGEIGTFIHKGYLYIRKFCPERSKTLLEPVNGIGKPLCITDLSDWYIFGTVVGVHRSLLQ